MTEPLATASELAGAARALLAGDQATTAGLWPRAAAALARQAIETALDRLWQVRAPGLQYTPARCQLLCLSTFLGDEPLAEQVQHAWGALSRCLHHHPYEVTPTAGELASWIAVADRLAATVDERVLAAAPAVPAR